MKGNTASLIISIVVLVISLVILPTYFKSIENSRDDAVRVQNAVRNFIDIAIDNQQISEDAIAALNLELASCTSVYSYKIYRDQKIVTPTAGGSYEVTWVTVEVHPGDTLVQGDFIIVDAQQESLSVFQRLSAILSSASYTKYSTRMSAMVR